jgi:hypothetical protein
MAIELVGPPLPSLEHLRPNRSEWPLCSIHRRFGTTRDKWMAIELVRPPLPSLEHLRPNRSEWPLGSIHRRLGTRRDKWMAIELVSPPVPWSLLNISVPIDPNGRSVQFTEDSVQGATNG